MKQGVVMLRRHEILHGVLETLRGEWGKSEKCNNLQGNKHGLLSSSPAALGFNAVDAAPFSIPISSIRAKD